ncbi:MAG TPA: hypothetical protein VKB84_16915 [Candidatus Binataceae bacterium]|jgi:hypothetical protein|nr:hypothetical protein [Candidatus Binataceae bacterium]
MSVKHDYFVEDLGQPRGWFKAHRYRYSCLRCGWAFLVEGSRGKLTALEGYDAPMSGPAAAIRIKTFVSGPCEPLPAAARHVLQAVKPPVRITRPAVRRRSDGIPEILAAK